MEEGTHSLSPASLECAIILSCSPGDGDVSGHWPGLFSYKFQWNIAIAVGGVDICIGVENETKEMYR